jgi:hypothetical protein
MVCGVTTDSYQRIESALYFACNNTTKEIFFFAPNIAANTNASVFNGSLKMVFTFYRKLLNKANL